MIGFKDRGVFGQGQGPGGGEASGNLKKVASGYQGQSKFGSLCERQQYERGWTEIPSFDCIGRE